MKFDSYTTKAGKTHPSFESPFATNAAAAEALSNLPGELNEFASDLLVAHSHKKWGGEAMSTGRAYWLHKLAMDEPRKAPEPAHNLNVERIVAMFDNAGEHLKRPKIVLSDGENNIKFYIAGERSKYTGNVMIVSPDYGGAYYGRIDREGNVFEARDMTPTVRKLVGEFSRDPEAVAGTHAKCTGRCCFCNQPIGEGADERSIAVGYGPKCAERYNLSWGTKVRGSLVQTQREAGEAIRKEEEVNSETVTWTSYPNKRTLAGETRHAHIDIAMGRADQLSEFIREAGAHRGAATRQRAELESIMSALGTTA